METARGQYFPNNQLITSLNTPTRVGILSKIRFHSDSFYFRVQLEDGKSGYIGRPFVATDSSGNLFYESNPVTGEKLRNGSQYSFSHGNNCVLHTAPLIVADMEKGEFETSADFEKRKSVLLSSTPWFSREITYTYVYDLDGKYDADTEIFKYSSYINLPKQHDSSLSFEDSCSFDLGYGLVSWEEDYVTRTGVAGTILSVVGAKVPKTFLSEPSYRNRLNVAKKIKRSIAPAYKEAVLLVGIMPTQVDSVSKGTNFARNNYSDLSGPEDHFTRLRGEVSYIFLLTRDGKNVIESYVAGHYQQNWQRDLQAQLAIAGFNIGKIDGVTGDKTKSALVQAVNDGILPDSELSMRSTMALLRYNRDSKP